MYKEDAFDHKNFLALYNIIRYTHYLIELYKKLTGQTPSVVYEYHSRRHYSAPYNRRRNKRDLPTNETLLGHVLQLIFRGILS